MEKNQKAPGQLDLVRIFANTWDAETGIDAFESLERARAWLTNAGLPTVDDSSSFETLVSFRNAVRTVLETHEGHGNGVTAWKALERVAAGICLHIHVAGEGELGLVPREGDPCAPVGKVLALIYDAVRDGTWTRLKICPAGDCAVAFYDYSKNGSGTWCSMAACGNREKARRRRRKSTFEPAT